MKYVSVIVPYYKKKKFIQATLNSILNQTYKHFEIILVYDDEDKTDLSFLKKLQKKDKRIKIILNKKNIGAGKSRNKAIKIAKGNYIAFLDSDDLWLKDKLKFQINFMKKKKALISSTSYKIIDEKNKSVSFRQTEKVITFEKLLRSCDIGLSTVIIKKNVFNKKIEFPDLKTKEDFVMWLQILKLFKCNVYGLNKVLTKWRKTRNSLSSDSIQKIFDGFKVYNKYLNFNIFKSIYFLLILSINFLRKNY